jgi:hypothetical protein
VLECHLGHHYIFRNGFTDKKIYNKASQLERMEVIMERIKPLIYSGLAVFIVGIIFFCVGSPALRADDVPRMDKDELKALLDNPDVVILDARTPSDWNKNEYKIKGAHRLDQSNVEGVETMYPKEKTIVVYCS